MLLPSRVCKSVSFICEDCLYPPAVLCDLFHDLFQSVAVSQTHCMLTTTCSVCFFQMLQDFAGPCVCNPSLVQDIMLCLYCYGALGVNITCAFALRCGRQS